jgi:hypothetical protein
MPSEALMDASTHDAPTAGALRVAVTYFTVAES